MKKNKKKIFIICLTIGILLLLSLAIYFLFNMRNENSLTLKENSWIDTNKHNIIDISIMNDIPIISNDGEGLVYDFLDYVNKETSLEFNIVTNKLDGTSDYNYKMEILSNISNNDIVLLEDNMVLITKNNLNYDNINSIDNLRLGVLASDKKIISEYFYGKNIQYIEYNSYSELKNSLNILQDTTDILSSVDGIIVLKTVFMKEMLENDYTISFEFNDLKKYFVLSIDGSQELYGILNKKFKQWKENNYEKTYNDNLLKNYFKFKNISDVEQKQLMSKNYVYGFVDYGIYNNLDNDKLSGLNGLILKEFNKFSSISITYTKYNSISNLLKDFNTKKVDFVFNIIDSSNYKTNVYNTIGIFDKELFVVSGINNKTVIDSIHSLKGKEILVVKDSYLEKYLSTKNMKLKLYNNMSDLTKDFDSDDIAIVDLENYNYYKSSSFKDSKIDYKLDITGKYNYVINSRQENNTFSDLFNFYISFISVENLISNNYNFVAYENINIVYILVIIIIALCIYLFTDFSIHIKSMIKTIKQNKKINLSKEDKLKYIDQLTSLKNRAYLNSQIESWDDSEVYPQSIIVIDLNNISYINDNYGREEGDKVITEAANILIQNQLQNSEIIRTDGNEFLIYMVGYTEKQVISYLRKLNRELKGLSHGFGAASGYSLITDAIKTVDDAVNEATIDMKNNKEEIDY